MPIELLTDNHREKIISVFENSKKSIYIISPFLTETTAKLFSKAVKSNHVSGKLITRFDHSAFQKGADGKSANSIKGLCTMQDAGIELFAVLNLHTKLYLIDDEIGIVGSANFTQSGLGKNVELSLYIEKEPELLSALKEYFDDICVACVEQNAQITKELLSKEKKRIEDENRNSKMAGPCKIVNPAKPFGAKIEWKEDGDLVQDLMDPKVSWDSNVWIKFEASSTTRRKGIEFFKDTHGPDATTFFSPSRKPKRIHEGDLIYIAVHAYNAEGKPTPMIAARARAHRFQESNYLENGTQWPYYLELYDMETLPGPLQDGISLYDLVARFGKDTYMHTKSRPKGANVFYSHRQQVCLGLAESAQEYLQQYFDKHFKADKD